MQHFLTLKDFSKSQILEILNLSFLIKQEFMRNPQTAPKLLQNKILGMIFDKPSTRTRVSFEAGIYQLGGNAIVLMGKDTQLGRGEPLKDTARVMSGMVDMIMMRTFEQERLEEFAKYSSVPVINGLTDMYHPVQVLADFMTMIECGFYQERREFDKSIDLPSKITNPVVGYVGDGNNMAHSWLYLAGIFGFELRIGCPKGFEPDSDVLNLALKMSQASGAKIILTQDPKQALQNCNVLTTDTWVSMGQEEQKQERMRIFKDYCIDNKSLQIAHEKAIFLHCLPAYRGYEVSEEVFEGAQSKVWQEAHNRLHIQKGIMVWLQQNR